MIPLEEKRIERVNKITIVLDEKEAKAEPDRLSSKLYQKVLENNGGCELEFILKSNKDFIKIKAHEGYGVRLTDNFVGHLKKSFVKNLKFSYVTT
jgi:hypothetical protein